MIRHYFIQAFAQLRQHPLISCISVVATALSIFLIMLVVMLYQVRVAPFTPESNRDRFLHVTHMSITNKTWGEGNSGNGPMSLKSAQSCYKSLTTPELVTIYSCSPIVYPVSVPGLPSVSASVRETDADYWSVFDFIFIDGHPFDEATLSSSIPVAVISEMVARSLFGTSEGVAGREFLFNYAPCRVSGVVRDVSPLASKAYAQVWIPYSTFTNVASSNWAGGNMGMMSVTILARDRNDFSIIREEARRRMDDYNKVIGENEYSILDRNRPYDQEKESIVTGANIEPDLNQERVRRFIMYIILLLVPAINLSSMTQSRIRQRISEIGIRRAFGCTRSEIAWQIIAENMIVSLLSGIIGLALCLSVMLLASDFFLETPFTSAYDGAIADSSILIHWPVFGYALLFCFLLNLLSTGIPAWKASRSHIIISLNGK